MSSLSLVTQPLDSRTAGGKCHVRMRSVKKTPYTRIGHSERAMRNKVLHVICAQLHQLAGSVKGEDENNGKNRDDMMVEITRASIFARQGESFRSCRKVVPCRLVGRSKDREAGPEDPEDERLCAATIRSSSRHSRKRKPEGDDRFEPVHAEHALRQKAQKGAE
eukprot:6324146-Prymnesium_polylepis.1